MVLRRWCRQRRNLVTADWTERNCGDPGSPGTSRGGKGVLRGSARWRRQTVRAEVSQRRAQAQRPLLETNSDESESPIGPHLANAGRDPYPPDSNTGAQPFYGYYFETLTKQGEHAGGGAKNYIVDGKMTEGFAFLAYPAQYATSGLMTFMVSQDGVVYQKDLGPKTTDLTKSISAYDPDTSWAKL